MRVSVLLEQLLAPVPGGTGRYSRELAAALARTAAADDVVAGHIAWHRDRRAAQVEGVQGPWRLPLARRALVAAWERGRGPRPRGVDLVHAPTLLFPSSHPLVVTIHDAVPWTHPQTLTPRGVRWHRRTAERAARFADAVTVPTAAVAESLCDVLPGLRRERVHVLGAGVSAALRAQPSPQAAAEIASRLRLPDRYLLAVATLEPRKGLDVAVDALARLGGCAPPLLVVGDPGWGGVDLPAAVRRAGLGADRVLSLGRIADADLRVVLRRAALLVMPSRAEGFGLPVAEAMAVGTPVVCTDVPALVETAGGAAEVVPVGDPDALAGAIDGLLADGPRRADLAARGLAQAPRFDWDAVARRAWQLYRELAG